MLGITFKEYRFTMYGMLDYQTLYFIPQLQNYTCIPSVIWVINHFDLPLNIKPAENYTD